jgi:biopolymer transport protein ExbD
MAISTSSGGGYGSRRRGGSHMLAEINVTPFVDVVLVLLIIFMLTAHVMEFGLEIDVPKVRAVERSVEDLPIVSIAKTGDVYLGDRMVTLAGLKSAIEGQYGKPAGVYVRADKDTIFDAFAQVADALGRAGYKVNVVTQPEESGKKR